MTKPTKRKGFNFLRSYFDVFNELKTDKDKLDFLTSIINKQFLDQDPKDLNFLTNLCYESQRHQIESSVKGWKRASKTDLIGNPLNTPTTTPTADPSTPKQEEEEKEKEKEQEEEESTYVVDFEKLLLIFNRILGKKAKVVSDKAKKQLRQRLKEGFEKPDIVTALKNASKDQFHIDSNYKFLTLEFITRPDKLEKFLNMSDFKIKRKHI